MTEISIITFSFIGAFLLVLAFFCGIFVQNVLLRQYMSKKEAGRWLEVDRRLSDLAKLVMNPDYGKPGFTDIKYQGKSVVPDKPATRPVDNDPGTFQMKPDRRTREEKYEEDALGRLLDEVEPKVEAEL